MPTVNIPNPNVPAFFSQNLTRLRDFFSYRTFFDYRTRLMNWVQVLLLPVLISFGYYTTRKKYTVNKNGIVLVTGASTGIGLSTAEFLAKRHSYVVYAGVRNDEDKQRLKDFGIKNLRPIIMDLNDHDSMVGAIDSIVQHMQNEQLPFVACIHNAGINRQLPAEFHPLDDVRTLFETNFFGVVDLTQLVLPLLRECKGRIIFLSSYVATQPSPLSSIYASSKTALEGFADALRREVANFGVAVSIIKPGYVRTEMTQKNELISRGLLGQEQLDQMKDTYSKLLGKEYQARFNSMVDKADQPIVVANQIAHAVSHPYPKTRYYSANVNGIPTWMLSWFTWVQDDQFQDAYLAV